MHHHKTYMYMYINFQQNRTFRSVKTVHTNLVAKNCKLHKFDPLTDFQADFEINQPIRYQITAKTNYFHRQTDGQRDGQTDGQTSRTTTIGSLFRKKKNILKMIKIYRKKKGKD